MYHDSSSLFISQTINRLSLACSFSDKLSLGNKFFHLSFKPTVIDRVGEENNVKKIIVLIAKTTPLWMLEVL